MKGKYNKKFFIWILAVAICILYIFFIYIDIANIKFFISSNIFKYISIILCFLIVLFIGRDALNRKDRFLLQTGLLITIFADLCLLILDYYIMGITLFCLVQIAYYIRYKSNINYRVSLIFIRFFMIYIFVIIVYFTLNKFIIKIDYVYIIAVFYAICLMLSFTASIKAFKNNLYPYPNNFMMVLGMALFVLCDINVAVSNLIKVEFTELAKISRLLIWIFYLPSQLLLAISGYKFKVRAKGSN